jgi:putative heme-binding domain-containing protein
MSDRSQQHPSSLCSGVRVKHLRLMLLVLGCGAAAGRSYGEDVPAPVHMFVPGFFVRELPVELTNLIHVEYAADGRLFAAGYDSRIHMLRDVDGDGLEEQVTTIWETVSEDYPLGFAVHDNAVYVLLQEELVRFVDSDGDDIPETREVVLSHWDDPQLLENPLVLRRRVDYAMGLAIADDGTIYIGMGNAAYDNPYMIDAEGKLGEKGQAHYTPRNLRGCVLKFAPGGGKPEQFVTGTRYLMCLQFNEHGDLFATDQEGATWLPNGNPFDELLHLEAGRHYGFPPRHPRYLPDAIDEPSVFDYAPQHQSLCGFRFNTGVPFGPRQWANDALVTGFSRGKLYRTKLVKTDAGYVAANQQIAALRSMPSDVSISPRGALVVACHSGDPDWGTGPSGAGRLYKLEYAATDAAVPVLAWAAAPGELRVAFDRALDAKALKNLTTAIRLESGRYVFAGDRLETIRPGYEVVRQQQAAPRTEIAVLSTALAADGRTLSLFVPAISRDANIAITLPALASGAEPEGSAGLPETDLQTDLHGVSAEWTATGADAPPLRQWLPHVELAVAEQLTEASQEHQRFFESLRRPGVLTLRGQLDLWEMLHPAVQPNSKLDYAREVEVVNVTLSAATSFQVRVEGVDYGSTEQGDEHRVAFQHTAKDESWLPFEIVVPTDGRDPRLQIRWSTSVDSRERAFPVRRFLAPWALPAVDDSPADVVRDPLPELANADRENGKRLFLGRATCSKCHQLRGEGAEIGPDLSNVIHRDYESVLRDIRSPSAAINPDYLSYDVVLATGRVLTGNIHSESPTAIQIADNAGKLSDIPRGDVEEMSASSVSIMPEDLLKELTPDEVRDLMAYLLLAPD